jgi:predicted nucleic acid-binding protein
LERKQVRRYITDASVAVKWFVEEQETDNALKLKRLFEDGEVDLEAPSLLAYEVASALRFHPKVRLTLKQFRAVREALDQMQITRDPNEREWALAYQLSLENAVSVYDAVYVSMALSGHSKMVTADATLLKKVKSPEIRQNLTTLTNLEL